MFLHPKWSASISTVVIALTIATIAVSCSSTPNPRIEAGVSVDTLGAEQQIRNSLAAWLSAYDRQDYVAMAKVWAPDILGWYPELPTFTMDNVRRGLSRQPTNDLTRAHIDLTIDEVLVQGDLAVVRDIWYYTRRFGTDSTIKRRMWGYEVWRKQSDGTWRISRYLSAPEKWVRIQ